MHVTEVTAGSPLLATLEYGEPLAEELTALASEASVASAWFFGTGAVQDAELGYYDQETFSKETVTVDEPLQMPVLTGMITAKAADAVTEKGARVQSTDPERNDHSKDQEPKDQSKDPEPTDQSQGWEPTDPPGSEHEIAAYAVLSRPSGQPLAGSLEAATVFTAEVYVQPFEESFERTDSTATGTDQLAL